MATPRYDSAWSATVNGIRDLFRRRERVPALRDDERLDGRVAVVTGANSGLGYAVAVQLARRGAEVWMACRSGIPEAGRRVRAESGSDRVHMLPVDLADLATIPALADALPGRIDVLVDNAAVVPGGPSVTPQGEEGMFAVNVLAKAALLTALQDRGRLAPDARVIYVGSESHRSGADVDPAALGERRAFGMKDVVGLYGHYKLALTAFAVGQDRFWNGRSAFGEAGSGPSAEGTPSVHALCPGPVRSNIARAAPGWAKPLLALVFRAFFQDPAVAAEPVLWLACARALDGRSGQYLHGMTPKGVDARAADPALADAVRAALVERVRAHGI